MSSHFRSEPQNEDQIYYWQMIYARPYYRMGAYLVGISSSGSSDWVGGGEKHEIYAAAFGGHLFMTYFYRAGGAMAPSPPLDPLLISAGELLHKPKLNRVST